MDHDRCSRQDLSITCQPSPDVIDLTKEAIPNPHSAKGPAATEEFQTCPGYNFALPAGHLPYASYPFLMHTTISIPWDVNIRGNKIMLRSHRCAETIPNNSPMCFSCKRIHDHSLVAGMRKRQISGTHESTPWMYLTSAEMYSSLQRKSAREKALKFKALNTARKLNTRNRHLEGWKRLIMAVGRDDIPRLRSLIATECRHGRSVFSMLEKIDRAALGTYRPRGYDEADFQRAFLLYKLGGRSAAKIAQRTLGIPSIDTAKRHIVTKPLRSSAAFPTTLEMSSNISSIYPKVPVNDVAPTKGMVIQVDEIKLQERLRWDPRSNMILGVCREHGSQCSLEFRSETQADLILDRLKKNEIHLASEVLFHILH